MRSLSILLGATFLFSSASALAQPPGSKAKNARPAAATPAPTAASSAREPAAAGPVAPTENPDTSPTTDKPERRISVGVLAGIGVNETKIKDEAGNELKEGVGTQGAGIGVRAGYTLPMKVYVGAMFMYHFGGSKEADKVHADLEGTKKKLMNQDFLAKAKPEVVQRERDQLELLDQTVTKLQKALEALRG